MNMNTSMNTSLSLHTSLNMNRSKNPRWVMNDALMDGRLMMDR
jgi:hypothetical protein